MKATLVAFDGYGNPNQAKPLELDSEATAAIMRHLGAAYPKTLQLEDWTKLVITVRKSA